MRNLFAALAVLAVLLLAGKFMLENKYKKELNRLAFMSSSFALVEFRKVEITFDGAIVVSGIRIEPRLTTDKFSIEKIRLFSSDRTFLFKGGDVFADGEFPDLFSMDVIGFEYDPSFGAEINPKRECRYIEEPVDYQRIGIDRARDNLLMSLNLEDISNGIFSISSDSTDIYTLEMEIKFDASDLNPVGIMQRDTLPILEISMESSFYESFADNLIEYCAKKLKISEEDYINKVIGSDSFMKFLGVRLSAEAKKALQDYMTGEADLGLVSQPSQSLKSINNLKLYKPKDIVSLLNLSVSSNGENIEKLLEIVNTPTEADGQVQAGVSNEILDEEELEKEPAGKSYKAIELKDVGQYVGQDIRIFRKGKSKVEGLFKSYLGGKVAVEAIGIRGYMTFNIHLSDIEKMEVYME